MNTRYKANVLDARETKTKLVIVADLGRMRAYRMEANPRFSRPRMTLIVDKESNITQRISNEVTDQFGRFRKEPAVPGAQSDGEEHNLGLQRRQRAIRALAGDIEQLIQREGVEACYFAAESRFNKSILAEMDGTTRAKIQKNVCANLSKADPEELVERLCEEDYGRK